ncbi:hypothetical protein [Fangia hongkongensis]|uniref:hypothetical protein n=1 Tax=Fangia hongkongensis TaxID=270495 RepID=UPI000371E805|nr:hypothetical protein [Fangia hongkongensis]MBK2125496.1 hypothetical protein [Fangia hongkongensis]
MDYLFECIEGALPKEGSMHYYAYRKLDEKLTQSLYALDQLKYQWMKASEFYFEPYPALQKLKWWQEELERLKKSAPSIPITHHLSKTLDCNLAYQLLQQDFELVMATLAEGRKENFDSYLTNNYLGIEHLKAKLLDFDNIEAISTTNHINELSRHLLLIGKHFSRNIQMNAEVRPESFGDYKQSFKPYIEMIQNLQQSQSRFVGLPKALANFNYILAFALKQYLKKVDNPFKESVVISPLQLLWSTVRASKL